jgi:hypothetical protein
MDLATATPNLATAVLSAHSGANKVSREALAHCVTPLATATHQPVPHAFLVDVIEETLHKRGLEIARQEYAIQTEGQKLFATFVLKSALRNDYSFALGLRSGNDKSMAVQMVAGANVFVCDNMALSGQLTTLCRKHTSGLDVRAEIAGGVNRAQERFALLADGIDRLKAHSLAGKDVVAKSVILDAALEGIIPLRLLPDVAKHYFEPIHDEFRERNLWTLHNAFTEVFKSMRPNLAMQASIDLGAMFQMGMTEQERTTARASRVRLEDLTVGQPMRQ